MAARTPAPGAVSGRPQGQAPAKRQDVSQKKYVDKPRHPKTVVVVAVVRIVPVAVRRARPIIVVVPRAAAQRPAGLLTGGLRSRPRDSRPIPPHTSIILLILEIAPARRANPIERRILT